MNVAKLGDTIIKTGICNYGIKQYHEVSASWTLPPEPCGHLSMHTALHMPSTNKISLFRVSHGDTPGILPAFSCGSLA